MNDGIKGCHKCGIKKDSRNLGLGHELPKQMYVKDKYVYSYLDPNEGGMKIFNNFD